MNLLITGASRGIGGAAYALLKSAGHKVAGHSTRGTDELIAGDLMDAGTPHWRVSTEGLTSSATMPEFTRALRTMIPTTTGMPRGHERSPSTSRLQPTFAGWRSRTFASGPGTPAASSTSPAAP